MTEPPDDRPPHLRLVPSQESSETPPAGPTDWSTTAPEPHGDASVHSNGDNRAGNAANGPIGLVAELAHLTARARQGTVTAEECNDLTGRTVTAHLESNGEFLAVEPPARLLYAPARGGGVVEVGERVEAWRNYLADLTDLTSSSRLRAIVARSVMRARSTARRVSSATFAGWDGRNLLLPAPDGQVLRIAPDGVELTGNVRGNLILLPDASWEPVPLQALEPADPTLPHFRRLLTESWSFDPSSAVSAAQQQALVIVWSMLPLLGSLVPVRPILLAYGPKAAGKTVALRALGRALLGSGFDVSAPGGAADFQAMASSMPLAVLDNVDSPAPWLEDALCRIATGQAPAMRQYFTNNSLVRFRCEGVVALTARTPRFRRPDVADRLLILRLAERAAAGHELHAERRIHELIREQRPIIWQEIVSCLRLLVVRLQGGVPAVGVRTRLADFAEVGAVIAGIIGMRDEFLGGLVAMERERERFVAPGQASPPPPSDLETILGHWLDGDPPQARAGVSSHELCVALREVAEGLPERLRVPSSAVALGRQMARLMRERRTGIVVTQRTVRGTALWSARRHRK